MAERIEGAGIAGNAPHLRAVERQRNAEEEDGFPFSVPAIRALRSLDLSQSVTFFVGENGSGKSTLLEGIALAARLPTIGTTEVHADATLAAQRRLARGFRLVWNRRTRKGFFLRAEDFFGFARRIAQMRAELAAELSQVDREYAGRSDLARVLKAGPLAGSLAQLQRLYGEGVDAQSHGESFLELFRARFVPGGLHLIDEPEAALSPQSQLGLLAMLMDMVAQDAQFVIATHSPILLAFRGARIYSFDAAPPEPAEFDELPHVTITRAFLADPDAFLRRL